MELKNEDLMPASMSTYAWRWTDDRHDLISTDIIQSIYAIRTARARIIHEQWSEREKAVRKTPERSIKIKSNLHKDIQAWLAALPSREGDRAVVSWNQEDAILLPWSTFFTYWDVFCYPSSDDVAIIPMRERWILAYTHWGEYCWKSLNESGLTTG